MTRDEEGSPTVAEDDDEAGGEEEEDEEKTEDWGALSSRFRHASEEGMGEEERQRNRMLNATTWLSSKMKVSKGSMKKEGWKV